jgi:hypothetical protein
MTFTAKKENLIFDAAYSPKPDPGCEKTKGIG